MFDPVIGQSLSHFRIVAKLGQGGMGEVYRAEDTILGRAVAIKLLPEEVAADSERRLCFEHEATLLASLNHPNISAVYSFEKAACTDSSAAGDEAAPIFFLVTELVGSDV